MIFSVISTFSGCGGSSLGYKMAGGDVRLAVEWDKHAVEIYKANFPDTTIYNDDITRLSVEECLRLAGTTNIDILDGSPPCQGFSSAGGRCYHDTRNQLFRQFVRLLRGVKPRVFVMENVGGMVKGKMRLIFAECLLALKGSGYRVKARLLNAMYYNVPQSRKRLIFIGVRDDLCIDPSYPKASFRHCGMRRLDSRDAKYSTNRFDDRIVRPGECSGTMTGISRKFWSKNREFGIKSYSMCGSFPNTWIWLGGFSAIKKRIGNSVPPNFMRAIAEHIRDNILTNEMKATSAS